jgi:hypothetical protein
VLTLLQQNQQEALLVKVQTHVALSTILQYTTILNVFQTTTLTLAYSVCHTMSHHPTLSSTGEELGLKEQAMSEVLLKRTLCMCADHCLNWLMWTLGQFLCVR